MNSEIECECVRRLLLDLGKDGFSLESQKPPAPDVRVLWPDGNSETFEVTEVHHDEVPGRGSAARIKEEQRAKHDPQEITVTWIPTNAMPTITHRVSEKVNKASGYAIRPNEPLSLLLVGALAKWGAVGATSVAWLFLTPELLNQHLHAFLEKSRFDRAYLHLQLLHALWEWSRPNGWRVLRSPQSSSDGRSTLEMLRSHANSGLLPGTRIVGSWP